jgi:hypothetical protein
MAVRWFRLSLIVIILVFGAAAVGAQEEQPAEETAAVEESAAVNETAESEATDEPEPAESKMSFDEVVDFETGSEISIDVQVGEVEVRGVEFLVKDAKSGFIASPFSSGNEDLKSELTVRANLATSADTKQKIGILVELLDGDENIIDRTGNNISFKDKSKIFTFKTTTLKWAIERVEKVRLRIEARN